MDIELTVKLINFFGTIIGCLEIIINCINETSLLISLEDDSKEKERGINIDNSVLVDSDITNFSINIDNSIIIVNNYYNYNKN